MKADWFLSSVIGILLFSCLEIKPSASIPHTDDSILKFGERITLHSKVLNETRDIWVYLPPNYSDKYFQPTRYPVLYILDGDVHFHSISGMMQILGAGMNGTFVIPEMIIVAIPNTDRTRDLTPTHSLKGVDGKDWDYLNASGGGSNFLKFIKNELIAKIDSNYRTFPYRIFAGHSFGGIEVVHALYTSPQTFNAYISIDPSLWWNNKELLKQGGDYFNTTDLKGKSFFIAQANTLSVEDSINNHFDAIKEFVTMLRSQNRSNLKWSYQYYENDNHGSVAFIAEYDALRFIFQKYYANFGTITSSKELKDHYHQFSDEVKVNFIPPERVAQQFGSIAMFRKQFALAQEYFQMNIDNYPQSSSAFANMGQLWLSKDDKKKALEYYEKSLDIYPENEDSKNNVRRLREEIK